MTMYVTRDSFLDGFKWTDVTEGETVYLNGYFDVLKIENLRVSTKVHIKAEEFSNVEIGALSFKNCQNIVFDGMSGDEPFKIKIHSEKSHQGGYNRLKLVDIDNCDEVTIKNCQIYSDGIYDTTDPTLWKKFAQHGVWIEDGSKCLTENNLIENTYHGITLASVGSSALSNKIYYFCGDGLRLIDNGTTADSNTIAYALRDCTPWVDCTGTDNRGNHADVIQMWHRSNPVDGTLSGLTVNNNNIYCPEISGSNYYLECQGICCFDGTIVDSDFIGNKVLTNHFHGITLTRPIDCTVSSNVVMPADESEVSWVNINSNKLNSSNTIENNKVYGNNLYIDGVQQRDPNIITVNGTEIENTNEFLDINDMKIERNKILVIFN